MAYEFRLPDIGEGLVEAEIVTWRVAVGDRVEMDQVVVDAETDKAVVEIPIPVAGTILHLGGSEGEVIEVGAILVVVGDEDEEWPAAGFGEPESGTGEAAPIVGTLDSEATLLTSHDRVGSQSDREPVQALPAVRRLAGELGVDLSSARPSGPHGRITQEDVRAAATAATSPAPEPPAADANDAADAEVPADEVSDGDEPQALDPVAATSDVEELDPDQSDSQAVGSGVRRPLSRVRAAIAGHMSRSWAEIPHVTVFDEVDASRLLEVKRALSRRTGETVSIDALVVKAVVPALRRYPDFNARLDGDHLIENEVLDVGVAVHTPDGLMVAVVRDVGDMGLADLAGRISEVAGAARERTATPGQLSGQTFTVSNIGALGGGYGTPIIPHGTVAILSVGMAKDRPVVRDGAVAIAPVMPLSLSYDHRVVDGAEGRRFLGMIVENLAEPALFLAD